MFVAIDDDGGVSLEEADDFSRFHVHVSAGFGAGSVDAALRSAEAGWAKDDDDQAYIAPDALLSLHPDSDAPWRASLDAMAASARRHGWWDEATASIAAHIVRAP